MKQLGEQGLWRVKESNTGFSGLDLKVDGPGICIDYNGFIHVNIIQNWRGEEVEIDGLAYFN